jgi:hypothetical protein
MGVNKDIKVYLNTQSSIAGGGGAFSPEHKGSVHILSSEKIKPSETGTLSHEFGHAKNFESLQKFKLIKPYMTSRSLASPGSVITSAIAVGAKDDKTAKKSAIVGSALAVPMFAEEAVATARGLHGLSKLHGGMWKGLTHGGGAASAAISIGSYGALASAPTLAYLARKHFKKDKVYKK